MRYPLFINSEDFPTLTLAAAFVPGTSTYARCTQAITTIELAINYDIFFGMPMTLVDGANKLTAVCVGADAGNKDLYLEVLTPSGTGAYTHTYPIGAQVKPYLSAETLNHAIKSLLINLGPAVSYITQAGDSDSSVISHSQANGLLVVENVYGAAITFTLNCNHYGASWVVGASNQTYRYKYTVFNDGNYDMTLVINVNDDSSNVVKTYSVTVPPRKSAFIGINSSRVYSASASDNVYSGAASYVIG